MYSVIFMLLYERVGIVGMHAGAGRAKIDSGDV